MLQQAIVLHGNGIIVPVRQLYFPDCAGSRQDRSTCMVLFQGGFKKKPILPASIESCKIGKVELSDWHCITFQKKCWEGKSGVTTLSLFLVLFMYLAAPEARNVTYCSLLVCCSKFPGKVWKKRDPNSRGNPEM
jgi:hypothetical protein